MRKGDLVTVTISSLSDEALGVALVEGSALRQEEGAVDISLRIAGAAPGDRVRARVEHVSPHQPVAWGSVVEVLSRGEAFVEPACPHAAPVRGACGGCPAMHLRYPRQVVMKAATTSAALGDLAPENLQVSAAASHQGYRARGHFVVHRTDDGEVVLGSYVPRSHEVVSMDGCRIVRSPVTVVAAQIEALATTLTVPVHPASPGVRYVTVRASQEGDVLVDLTLNHDEAPFLERLAEGVMALEEVVGVSVSINASGGIALLVGPSRVLLGQETVVEWLGEVGVVVSAAGFTQLHAGTAGDMYRQAAAWLGPVENIWDLYCGVGGFGLSVAKTGSGKVYGAENSPGACDMAGASATLAGLNATYEVADLRKPFDVAKRWPRPNAVLVNPPRRGLDEPVRTLLCDLGVPVVYMSCNPTSFAKDARVLLESGLKLVAVEAFDMLPQTRHVELLAFFEVSEEE